MNRDSRKWNTVIIIIYQRGRHTQYAKPIQGVHL